MTLAVALAITSARASASAPWNYTDQLGDCYRDDWSGKVDVIVSR